MSGKIKKIGKYVGLTLGSLLLVLAAFAAHEWYAKPFFIGNFANRVFVQYLIKSPEDLTYLGIFEQFGITGHNAEWNDDSQAAVKERTEFIRQTIDTLDSYDVSGLTDEWRVSVEVVKVFLGNPEQDWRFRLHDYPVNQLDGLQLEIPDLLLALQAVNTGKDAEHYISRLSKVGIKMAQNMEGLLLREDKGMIPPTFVIDKSLAGMRTFVATPPEDNALYTSLKSKMEDSDAIGVEAREEFLRAARREIEAVVYPAYQQYIDYFTALRAKSNSDAGIWKLPDGDAYYNYCLRVHTTTEMTAEEIHALGLAEVARIESEIRGIFEAEGFDTSRGLKAMFDALANDERFYYPDTELGRNQILEDYTQIISEIDEGLGSAFNVRPAAPLVVERVPAAREQTSGAYYNAPAGDGSRPGVFYANLYDVRATPKYGMRTLAYHEAIPGHHLQAAVQLELDKLPAFRTAVDFTAYSEGWGLYAERLAWEMGFLSDPYDNLGRLQLEMLRAVRLVVDTGIHAKRWTREEAIDYMLEKTGRAESEVVSEIERYIVLPGQATAYTVGMLEILRLRSEAQMALGDDYDIRDFHDVVLLHGPLPLTVLRDLVMQYIARKQSES
ncbi:DUF885 domain-containing protein [Congregibacter variabilis]|uniref:DUF885 domain-containing protein n=1 Tax=Congregibacter variabilis TaxID=3081200 RepID=A0ABZ0I6E1_9GAMM|nr:DUF885 domain-containing protein [Congregibacter sp. IMCC43200]